MRWPERSDWRRSLWAAKAGPAPDARRDAFLRFGVPALFASQFVVSESLARLVCTVVLIGVLLLLWDRQTAARIVRTPAFLAVGTYLGFGLISMAWSDTSLADRLESVGRFLNMMAFIFFLALLLVRRPDTLRHAERVFVAVAALSCLVAMSLYVADLGFSRFDRLSGTGSLRNPVKAAILIGAALIVALVSVLPSLDRRRAKAACLLAVAVLLAALVLTESRGPVLGVVAALAAVMLLGAGRRVALGALAVVTVAAALALTVGWDELVSRGSNYRFDVWREAIARGSEAPWFGAGWGTPQRFLQPDGVIIKFSHNVFITAYLRSGGVGLLLQLVMLALLFGAAWRQRPVVGLLPLALLVFVSVYGMFDRQLDLRNLVPEYFTLWYAAGLLAGAAALEQRSWHLWPRFGSRTGL